MWSDLSLRQRAQLIQMGVRAGIGDAVQIRKLYDQQSLSNRFDDGGDKKPYRYFTKKDERGNEYRIPLEEAFLDMINYYHPFSPPGTDTYTNEEWNNLEQQNNKKIKNEFNRLRAYINAAAPDLDDQQQLAALIGLYENPQNLQPFIRSLQQGNPDYRYIQASTGPENARRKQWWNRPDSRFDIDTDAGFRPYGEGMNLYMQEVEIVAPKLQKPEQPLPEIELEPYRKVRGVAPIMPTSRHEEEKKAKPTVRRRTGLPIGFDPEALQTNYGELDNHHYKTFFSSLAPEKVIPQNQQTELDNVRNTAFLQRMYDIAHPEYVNEDFYVNPMATSAAYGGNLYPGGGWLYNSLFGLSPTFSFEAGKRIHPNYKDQRTLLGGAAHAYWGPTAGKWVDRASTVASYIPRVGTALNAGDFFWDMYRGDYNGALQDAMSTATGYAKDRINSYENTDNDYISSLKPISSGSYYTVNTIDALSDMHIPWYDNMHEDLTAPHYTLDPVVVVGKKPRAYGGNLYPYGGSYIGDPRSPLNTIYRTINTPKFTDELTRRILVNNKIQEAITKARKPEDIEEKSFYDSDDWMNDEGKIRNYALVDSEPVIIGQAPAQLNTYYPGLGNKYPFTGHSQLFIPVSPGLLRAYEQPETNLNEQAYVEVDKTMASPSYNLLTNNCADAVNRYLGYPERSGLLEPWTLKSAVERLHNGKTEERDIYDKKVGMDRTFIPMTREDEYRAMNLWNKDNDPETSDIIYLRTNMKNLDYDIRGNVHRVPHQGGIDDKNLRFGEGNYVYMPTSYFLDIPENWMMGKDGQMFKRYITEKNSYLK